MKKLLLPLLSILVLTACQKISTDLMLEEIATSAKQSSAKINICHFDAVSGISKTINVNIKSWSAHQAHGDVRLNDQDGDGYVPNNECGFGSQGDCDDNNAAVNPGATEICGNGIDENCNGMNDDVCGTIGSPYQGGIIAYILQPNDPGYSATVMHGLIASPTDQGKFEWGCRGIPLIGADGIGLGTGNQNTIDIMNGCPTENIAARVCGNLVLGGYSDWYLPSRDELIILYTNRAAIGGFTYPYYDSEYWSSTERGDDQQYAYSVDFTYNGQSMGVPKGSRYVRAVRSF